jgi:anthranilate synthase/aminodeoxychorismate synthase-like glutamine amidotransferase
MKKFKKILLVDNFDSFTFNLVDYFKQFGCKVDVYRNTVDVKKIEEINPDLIVFSPGPSIPKNAGNMMKIIDIYHKKYPMFGVCLGHEAFIEYFGGSLKFVKPVHGKSSLIKHDGKTIFKNIEDRFSAGRYHSLCADKTPNCFHVTATTDSLVMAIRHKNLPIEGVQFHPESVLTMKGGNGKKMIGNIVYKNFANVK